jgi:hemin uptake protein HemP
MKPAASPAPAASRTPAGAAFVADITRSGTLFGSRRELVIEHAGCLYRLRITQNNKLILTK